MELLDRYLQAVRFWLPSAQQDDVVAELAEDIRSQIEEKEAELGRKLDEAELEALLKRRGHPLWVAEPFLPHKHLISPVLVPAFWRVVKIAVASLLTIFAGLYVVFGLIVKDVASNPALAQPSFWLWQLCLYSFALVGLLTVIFALLERSQVRARSLDAWDPRKPQALSSVPADPAAERRRKLRAASAGELIGGVIFTLWWLGMLRLPSIPEVAIRLTPVWQALYWPILVLALAGVGLALATTLRPRRTRLHSGFSLARDIFGLVLVALLLGAGQWVEVTVPGAPLARAGDVEELSRWANVSVAITLVVIGASYLAAGVRDARRLLGKGPSPHRAFRLLFGD